MSPTPSYPKDALVAPPPGAPETPSAPIDPDKRPLTTGPPGPAGTKPAESRRSKHLVAGAAIGIGSAALVAALLYANRSRKS